MIMIRINPKMSNGGYPRPIQSALREIERCSVNSALIHCSFQIPTCSIDDLCAPPTYTMKHVCPHPRTNSTTLNSSCGARLPWSRNSPLSFDICVTRRVEAWLFRQIYLEPFFDNQVFKHYVCQYTQQQKQPLWCNNWGLGGWISNFSPNAILHSDRLLRMESIPLQSSSRYLVVKKIHKVHWHCVEMMHNEFILNTSQIDTKEGIPQDIFYPRGWYYQGQEPALTGLGLLVLTSANFFNELCAHSMFFPYLSYVNVWSLEM